MIVVKVTFKISNELNYETLREKFLETAPMYKETNGLIRKNYICDFDKRVAGGIYCFEDRQKAEEWFDDERITWLANRYAEPEIVYFESPVVVDNTIGKIIS